MRRSFISLIFCLIFIELAHQPASASCRTELSGVEDIVILAHSDQAEFVTRLLHTLNSSTQSKQIRVMMVSDSGMFHLDSKQISGGEAKHILSSASAVLAVISLSASQSEILKELWYRVVDQCLSARTKKFIPVHAQPVASLPKAISSFSGVNLEYPENSIRYSREMRRLRKAIGFKK